MFDLVFLGTSASAPSIYRGLPATAVLAGEDRFLVDCGEGTQRQILRSGIGFKKLNRILLTHAHLDHILGLGGLVSTFTRWENIYDIHLYGGLPTLERVRRLLYDVVHVGGNSPTELHFYEVSAGLVYEGRGYSVQAFPVAHRGRGSFGYILQEDVHHPFLVDKAEALGVPPGPERGRLVGGETVTLEGGRVITPDMVLGDPVAGVKIAFTGDTGRTDNLLEAVANADVLISEATFLDEEREVAQQFGHITARQAAELARDAQVRYLILTHISRRYRESDVLREAKAVFPQTIVARDLDHYSIRRGKALKKVQPER